MNKINMFKMLIESKIDNAFMNMDHQDTLNHTSSEYEHVNFNECRDALKAEISKNIDLIFKDENLQK